jgi:hypothetical protein
MEYMHIEYYSAIKKKNPFHKNGTGEYYSNIIEHAREAGLCSKYIMYIISSKQFLTILW